MAQKFRRSDRSAATRAARQAAVQGLYEMEISGASLDSVLMDYLHDRWSGLAGHTAGDELDRKKLADILRGVAASKTDLDRMIGGSLDRDRSVEGLDVLLLTILRAGCHELFAEPKVPAKVVISEYVGITQTFYGDNEPALVNGVLDRVARVLRVDELGERPRE